MDVMELCKSIDIVDFFSQYTDLTQKGNEWWGLTPFREEKTPSFAVNPELQTFYCFSTGIGGNVLEFLKRYYHCSLRDAVERLKAYCGVENLELSEPTRLVATKICKKFRQRPNGMKQSSAKTLPGNCMDKFIRDEHLDLWMAEGISAETLDKFQVRYDPMVNRLVYPIRDIDGGIVNIGGRTLDPDFKEKGIKKYCYYQSWGTISTIYGLYENREGILKAGNITLFEGAKSVMITDTWGIRDCGSILTSHLGINQMMTLLKFCSQNNISITFALDKEIDIRKDKHIMQLKRYLNIYYLWDKYNLLPDSKMAPVDMGEAVYRKLFEERLKL